MFSGIFSNSVSCNVEQSSGAKPISPVKGGSQLTFYTAQQYTFVHNSTHLYTFVHNSTHWCTFAHISENSILHINAQGLNGLKHVLHTVQCTLHTAPNWTEESSSDMAFLSCPPPPHRHHLLYILFCDQK